MSKVIHTNIDSEGNVQVDIDGFDHMDCLKEEERFRRELSALGLEVGLEEKTGQPPRLFQRNGQSRASRISNTSP